MYTRGVRGQGLGIDRRRCCCGVGVQEGDLLGEIVQSDALHVGQYRHGNAFRIVGSGGSGGGSSGGSGGGVGTRQYQQNTRRSDTTSRVRSVKSGASATVL